MNKSENCIFCKIVAGEIPAEKTYEDDDIIAFLDISPKSPGHTLVIPKAHYQWFHKLPANLYTHLFTTVKKLTPEILEKNNADIMKISVVGTEVPHTHVHLIPFKQTDSPEI